MINKKQFTCTKNGRLDEILAEHLQLSGLDISPV